MTDPVNQPDIVPLNSIDDFALLVIAWQQNVLAQLKQLYDIPEGTPVDVVLEETAPEEELVLEGNTLKGFKTGLATAISLFKQLPFEAQEVEGDPVDDNPTKT